MDQKNAAFFYDGRKDQFFVDGENLQELPNSLILHPCHIDLRWVRRKLMLEWTARKEQVDQSADRKSTNWDLQEVK